MISNLNLSQSLVPPKKILMPSKSNHATDIEIQEEWVLIQKAQADRQFFKPLYERYHEGIFRFVYKRTADEAKSADITSTVFLKAMQKLDKYTFKGVPFSAWLYRIASNEVVQHFRNVKKNRVVSINDSQLESMADELEYNDEKYKLKDKMVDCLQHLKEEELQLIELRYFEQLPFREIAEITGLTESNAKVKTYRIKTKLSKIINDKYQKS
jgi:RNA polymerase sigma-70 factor (ECF subfamily)